MENTQLTIETLNDLIMINNDRIAGYEKAMEELKGKETDLTVLFEKMIIATTKTNNINGSDQKKIGTTTRWNW